MANLRSLRPIISIFSNFESSGIFQTILEFYAEIRDFLISSTWNFPIFSNLHAADRNGAGEAGKDADELYPVC